METIKPKSWKGVKKAIEDIRKEYENRAIELSNGKVFKKQNRILYRGHADTNWKLKTTLERRTSQRLNVSQYLTHTDYCLNEIESFTEKNWKTLTFSQIQKKIADTHDTFRVTLPNYEYLVYLRHHGFPSPLLDWTESPFIASFFAYAHASINNASIYCYIERPEGVKGGQGGDPMISLQGPYATTDKRHFAQKAWYTIATKWSYTDKCHYFCNHEDVFQRNDPSQDILYKIVLPIKHKTEALKELQDFNINHFTLFHSEDSLIETMAMRRFDLNIV